VSATASSALQSGSWAPGGAGAFDVWFSDPGGEAATFVHWALEYVAPLNQWINELTGDKAQIAAFANTWNGVATDLDGFEAEMRASANRINDLEGRLARALRKRHDEVSEVLTHATEWSTATASAVELASTIVQAVHDAVVGALSQLSGLIVTLFVPSLDPFDKIYKLRQLTNRAQGFIDVIGQLIERMIDAFERLVALLNSLVPLIQDGLLYLRETLGVLLRDLSPALGLLPGLIGGAYADLLAGDPRVTELDPGDLTDDVQHTAWENANAVTEFDSLSDLITGNGYVDLMGKQDRSVINISQVVDANNDTHWVVALPSTQDWGLIKKLFGSDFADTLKDYPPTNDLDSNIALMLMQNPHLATQYQRAVLQAMSDAGVPAGGDVVYTGFSQGGIMAATLATTPSPYNVVGVVTNGSPIGGFDIPSTIPVVSFEHFGDPVPLLDGQPIDTKALDSPNRHVIVLPTPGNNFSPDNTHSNPNYIDSVKDWEASDGPSTVGIPDFFSGSVVDNQQHTWGE
jgi:hypothetical protein